MTLQQHRAGEAFIHRGYFGNPGLGDARPITSAIGAGLLSAGGVIAMIPGGQIPGAIVAAVGAITGLIGSLFAPDVTKIEATHIVDQIAAQLDQLLTSWHALPAEKKTQTMQAAYLEVVDGAFAKVQQGCSNPALGTAGQRCISERLVRGGTAPWCPNPGNTGCDWYVLYRNPIADDPQVVPDQALALVFNGAPASGGSVSSGIDIAVSGVSQALGGMSPLWIGVGIIAAAVLFLGDS